jgi:hypothetical protein
MCVAVDPSYTSTVTSAADAPSTLETYSEITRIVLLLDELLLTIAEALVPTACFAFFASTLVGLTRSGIAIAYS